MDEANLKILVLGPSNGAKSTISDFLAGSSKTSNSYSPTMGVRILELNRDIPHARGGGSCSCTVELWDCSGDRKHEYTWPALMKDADGILFVCVAGNRNSERDLEIW